MKKMLITGVNGFIGRSAKEYFEKAYDIVGIDIAEKYMGREDTGSLTYYQCNMSKDPAELSMLMSNVQPDVILHCAGSANVGASVLNPMADLDGNLHSLYQLLISLKAIEKKPKIIFMSSAAVYGNPVSLPIKETDTPAPISPYGLHKLMCEQLCHYYNEVHGYHIRCIRIFSAYGSGIRKQIFWDIYQKYLANGKINLFGTGDETRDFIHVSDIMYAMDCILNYDGAEEIFNVANGEEISIRDLAVSYAKKLGETADSVSFNGEVKAGDPRNWQADISLLKKTGYAKKVEFSDGVGDYVDWVKKQGV